MKLRLDPSAELVRTSEVRTANRAANLPYDVRTSQNPRNSRDSGEYCSAASQPVFLDVKESANLLGVTPRFVQKTAGKYETRQVTGRGGTRIQIALSSLPQDAQLRYWKANLPQPQEEPAERADIIEHESRAYREAPEYNRRKADKYRLLLRQTAGMKKRELESFIEAWNAENADMRTSVRSLYRMRGEYGQRGIVALLGAYGKTRNRAIAFEAVTSDGPNAAQQQAILEQCYDTFRKLFLTEGAPSPHDCWRAAFGVWVKQSGGLTALFDESSFPHADTFLRRVQRELSEDAIYMARNGSEAWNRRYGMYLDRELSGINPQEVLVGDHHQLDVATRVPVSGIMSSFDLMRPGKKLNTDRVVFPWLSAFMDFRTTRLVGFVLHVESPNSDHVFASAHHAISRFGLCRAMILDNGKDYRCRDFAGGRTTHQKVTYDVRATESFTAALGIQTIWALPYNAQAKLIERTFRKIKDSFAKFARGYRGGDVTERPERLEGEIKRGEIMTWEQLCECAEAFIETVLNTTPVEGKHLGGLSPVQAWSALQSPQGYIPHRVTEDALSLYAMRVGQPKRLGRNGFHDPQLDMHYWSEWMSGCRGRSVYMRRDPRRWQIGWFFDAATHEFIGTADLLPIVPGVASSDLDRAQVREMIRIKRQDAKLKRAMIAVSDRPSSMEIIDAMAAANAAQAPLHTEEAEQSAVVRMTWGDGVMQQQQRALKTGTYDVAKIMPPDPPRKVKKFALFECDMEPEDE